MKLTSIVYPEARSIVFHWSMPGVMCGLSRLRKVDWLGKTEPTICSQLIMPVLILLGYVASGVGFGMRISLLAAIPADLFAGRHLGVILGAAQGGGGLGGFIGPFLGGWLFDVTGSYQVAFAVAALAIAASAVAAWVAAPRRARATRHATSRIGP